MSINRTCSIDGCDKRHLARSYCKAHYLRWYKHGDPLAGGTSPNEATIFYRDIVLPYEGVECISWPYSRDTHGYGRMGENGKIVCVSRALCEEMNGPPPTPEHDAAHSCGKGHEGCVTKGHLSWKTKTENQADRLIHGTHQNGERNHMAKLTEEQARNILSLKGKEKQQSIADRFCVSNKAVSDIHRGARWAWLQDSAKRVPKPELPRRPLYQENNNG